jgi:hypothetical protein
MGIGNGGVPLVARRSSRNGTDSWIPVQGLQFLRILQSRDEFARVETSSGWHRGWHAPSQLRFLALTVFSEGISDCPAAGENGLGSHDAAAIGLRSSPVCKTKRR